MNLLPLLAILRIGFGNPLPHEFNPTATDFVNGPVSTEAENTNITISGLDTSTSSAFDSTVPSSIANSNPTNTLTTTASISSVLSSPLAESTPSSFSLINPYFEETSFYKEPHPTPESSTESPTIYAPYQTEDSQSTSLVDSVTSIDSIASIDPTTSDTPALPSPPPPPPSPPPPLLSPSPQPQIQDFSSPYHDASGQPLHPATQTPPHVPRANPVTSLFHKIVKAISSSKSLIRRAQNDPPTEDMPQNMPLDILFTHEVKPALGINCRGPTPCSFDRSDHKFLALSLNHLIERLDDNISYTHLQKVACADSLVFPAKPTGYLCAWFDFAKRTNTSYYETLDGGRWVTAWNVKRLAKEILRHKCRRCGSVPIEYPLHNDNSLGFFTFMAHPQGCPGEEFEIDAICTHQDMAADAHDPLVGAEVSETNNGTKDYDGSNDTRSVPFFP
ncbi:hypothetical protein TWF788_010867 [Orbilia oligospora]|uniref:Killer toxin Kp4 domain-containing protein n=1 Tax=Orbilia oligospora TaxID=2813651 RepID=A0A7C8PIY8_ORBOL|nr:hypothetical protein TWF788_010867 [Orbilia oligospora]